MAWSAEAIGDVYSALMSPMKGLAAFSSVIQHEPVSAPPDRSVAVAWSDGPGPARGLSGLSATSARIEFTARVYVSYTKAAESVDPKLMSLVSSLMGVLTGKFTLGGEVMEIDLLGTYGNPLSARPGWTNFDSHEYRIADVTIPVIADGLWVQVP
jgi:hypothetical protein